LLKKRIQPVFVVFKIWLLKENPLEVPYDRQSKNLKENGNLLMRPSRATRVLLGGPESTT